jgi:hypothetical protein
MIQLLNTTLLFDKNKIGRKQVSRRKHYGRFYFVAQTCVTFLLQLDHLYYGLGSIVNH